MVGDGFLLFVSPSILLKDKVRFYMPCNFKPIIIGFYYGSKKPEANELLRCLFKEMHIAHKRRLYTLFLWYYIGDGPLRQIAKGFPLLQSYSGCARLVSHFKLYCLYIPTYDSSFQVPIMNFVSFQLIGSSFQLKI